MKCRKCFILLALLALTARGAASFSGAQDRAARQARVVQEIGLQTSAQAIKTLEDRKAEEDKLFPAERAERERLETLRREEQSRADEAQRKAQEEAQLEERRKVEAARLSEEERLRAENERQAAAKAQDQRALSGKQAEAVARTAQAQPTTEAAKTAQQPAASHGAVVASLPPAKQSGPEPKPELKELGIYPVVPVNEEDEESPKSHGASQSIAYGKLLSDGPKNKPYIAFTFDDGPGHNTKQILHLLAFYRAKATFFMLGDSLETFPDLAREVAAEGHLLANHTWSHTNFYNYYDPEKLQSEIIKTYAQIQMLTGKKTYFVRIPYGVSKQWAKEAAGKAEHLLVNWTYGVDTRLEKTQEEMLAGYTANLRPGAIFLFHDGGRQKPKTVWVVERLLEECRRRGLKPVTLDTMFSLDHARFPRPAVVSPLPQKRSSPRRAM